MNKKRNRILNISILAILLLSIIAVTAYAKYITTINASTSLQVAKWNFKVNGSEDNLGTINLGRKTYSADSVADGMIAPGTSGSFNVTIDASGTNTDVKYDITFGEVANKPENLYFTIGVDPISATVSQKHYTFDSLSTALSDTIKASDTEKIKDITINWAWDYETTDNGLSISENDIQDTLDGKSAQDFSFNMYITGKQLTPTAA